jgi:hypothetical protein
MPRSRNPPAAEFVGLKEAMAVLGFEPHQERSFRANYLHLLSDHRPPHLSKHRTPLRISRAELRVVVSEGWDALLDYQVKMGLRKRGR